MTDFKKIYAEKAEAYDALVSAEDYQGNLARALAEIRPSSIKTYLDVGAGTGRVAAFNVPQATRSLVCDISPHMLSVARRKLAAPNLTLLVADNRALPLADQAADFATAGWSFGHFTGWYPDGWQAEIEQAVGELLRVIRPGGTAVILETLGTGFTTPTPPNPALAAYYHLLETQFGFQRRWLRMDYRFNSPDEAAATLGFFFGEPFADKIKQNDWAIVPECTGLWWKVL